MPLPHYEPTGQILATPCCNSDPTHARLTPRAAQTPARQQHRRLTPRRSSRHSHLTNPQRPHPKAGPPQHRHPHFELSNIGTLANNRRQPRPATPRTNPRTAPHRPTPNHRPLSITNHPHIRGPCLTHPPASNQPPNRRPAPHEPRPEPPLNSPPPPISALQI
jgi:hypothetical protein